MKHQSFFKPWLLLAVALMATMPLLAQMVSNYNVDEVYKIDQSARMAYRPGEIIVKFKASSPVNIKSVNGKFSTSRVNAVDAVLNSLGVKEAEQLMPLTGAVKGQPRRAKALSGRVVTEPDLSLLYCLKFEQEDLTVEEVVEALKALDEVEYAEPNYLVFIQTTDDATSYQSEPMYDLQWGLNAIKLPQLWAMDKVETERPVIAILDTGVDITHPDLTDNIWTNSHEAHGSDYEDDDNNGYVDDVHGWDFVAGTPIINNGMDRNGHGTHCAGIAAAVGNNGIGITGANPDAYILPIKVMGDDGTGDVATICRGIDYAVACKAHVLSMSFGGGCSAAEYQALTKALTNFAVLCGAAGNDGYSIYSKYNPVFPGAYDIVLGVMASDANGQLASFSNYDPDGPFFSRYNMDKAFSIDVTWNDERMWNYDLMAPGVDIMSSYLNGGYKSLNGTSMATPMVAGAISRILQVKGYDYARDYGLMGDMAMAKDGSYLDLAVFDALKASNYDEGSREVALALTALEIDDSEGDGDGRFDAGETINIWPTIRSLWGHAENIKISIEPYDENTPTDAIEVLNNNVDFGWSLNSRGSYKSKNPISVHVNENAYDGMHLPYKIVITSDNLLANIEQEHVFEVENGIELGGAILEDMILYPDKHYIVTKSLAVPEGVTLTVLPGTRLEFNKNVYIKFFGGRLISNGTPEHPIVFMPRKGQNSWVGFISCPDTISYCILKNFTGQCYQLRTTNCVFDGFNATEFFQFAGCGINNNYINCDNGGTGIINPNNHYYNIFVNVGSGKPWSYRNLNFSNLVHSGGELNGIRGFYIICASSDGVYTEHSDTPSWLGSGKEEVIRPYVFDSMNPYATNVFATVDLSNMPTRPIRDTHGIVWKVVVDGYDAQDEFDLLPPLGVGKHKFEVYFNRDDMDTTATPTITMDFRPPYTRIPIAEDGFWSVKDSVDVYTAFLTITGKTNADGLNRIYVTGAKDYDHFDVPDEYWRFNVMVQAAGSMATGFAAEPGLGKVDLTWNNENNDMEDAMGYNVYRYQMVNDNTAGDTIRINEVMLDVDAEAYTDYDVTPGETYYYYYKVMSTDLKEYDISNVVAATPLTSIKGDANGSMHVDVADIVSIVAYLSQQQPQPFIYEAADVNEDGNINILDIVGVINIIAHPEVNAALSIMSGAVYTIEDGILYVNSPVALGGVQVMVNAPEGTEVKTLEALDAMERMWIQMDENTRLLLAYSMTGKTIPAGKTALLELGNVPVTDIVLSDAMGNNIMVEQGDVTTVTEVRAEVKPVATGIYDLMGRKISSDVRQLKHLQPGIYIVNGVKTAKF
jgi:subtilisin family serine protease